MGGTMPRQNYSIIVCLIFLGVAVLVRTVAIAQRAYDVLLPPVSGDDRVPTIIAVTTGHTGEPSVTGNAHSVVPSALSAPSVEGSPPNVVGENVPDVSSQARGQVPPERSHKKIIRARRHYGAGYSYRSDRRFWPKWW
jgi:hypothetical protein